jgi:acyl-coenzyme A synthetase/AMP-(fatty) acid ligase
MPQLPMHSLDQCWQKTVRRAPDALAVVDEETGRAWTRAELESAASTWLARHGPGSSLGGRFVLMADPNGASWFHVFLGLLRAGAIPVPADATEPAATLMETARTVGCAWIWHGGRLEPVASPPAVRRRDLCLVKLTSGSTGAPRARPFTHAQMLGDGRQVCATMGIRPDDLNLAVIPLGHSYGLGNLVVPLIAQGTALVCAASPLPNVLATECARWRPTVFPAVPTLLRALVRADVDTGAFSSLRLVISAGSVLPPCDAAAFAEKFGRRVHGFYGTSETGGISYDRSGAATLAGRSVGAPMEGVALHWRQRRRFSVESAAVMGTGSFSPADRGQINEFGELVLLGRAGRLVKIAGRRLDLAEIECSLKAVPGVRDACAMAHPALADALAAAVATDLSPAVVRQALRATLAPWKIPKRLLALPEFPHTARGKTDRRRIEALLAASGSALRKT